MKGRLAKRNALPAFAIKGKMSTKRQREYVSTSNSTNRFYGIMLRSNRLYQCFQCEAGDVHMNHKEMIGKPFKGKDFSANMPKVLEKGFIYGIKRVKPEVSTPLPNDYSYDRHFR